MSKGPYDDLAEPAPKPSSKAEKDWEEYDKRSKLSKRLFGEPLGAEEAIEPFGWP